MKLVYLPERERIEVIPKNNVELNTLKNWFNRYEEGYQYDPRFKNRIWNGKSTTFDKRDNTVAMGLWREIYKCCDLNNFEFNFVNKNEFPLNRTVKKKDFEEFVTNFFDGYKIGGNDFNVRPYQFRTAYSLLKNRYGNIAVATGGGKTLIYTLVLFYLLKHNPDKKFLLVVPSKTLVTQFYDDIQEFNWRNELDLNIQEIFGEEEKPRTTNPDKEPNICIGTFQSLSNFDNYSADFFRQFYSVVTDECLHPETLITMSDGTQKMIKNINIGELVKTVNEETLKIENKPVEKIHHNLNKGQQMYEIEMVDGSIIKITGNHKIKLTDGSWIKAENLKGNEDILYIK